MAVTISNTEHECNMLNTVRSFLQRESYVDVVLVCDGRKLMAHKLLLGAVSPFLKSILDADTSELATVLLPGVSYRVMSLVLDFLYGGFMKLDQQELEEFTAIVKMLHMNIPHVSQQSASSFRSHGIPTQMEKERHQGAAQPQPQMQQQQPQQIREPERVPGPSCKSGSTSREMRMMSEPPPNDEADPLHDPLDVPDLYFVAAQTNQSANRGRSFSSEGDGTPQAKRQRPGDPNQASKTQNSQNVDNVPAKPVESLEPVKRGRGRPRKVTQQEEASPVKGGKEPIGNRKEEQVKMNPNARLQGQHFPTPIPDAKYNCHVCRNTTLKAPVLRDTNYVCLSCHPKGVPLCVTPCFKAYHTQLTF